jgi:nitrogen PTS system EIIA component
MSSPRLVGRIGPIAMNPVGALLAPEDICLDVDVSTKEQLLEQVAALLAARHGLSKTFILESLTVREQMGSTGVGHGVAIPHARMNQCAMAAGVFLRTKNAIPFDAPDGKPVSVFLGLIVPNKAAELHLQILATAAGMLGDRDFREKLKVCTDPLVVAELLAAWPDTPPVLASVAVPNPENPTTCDESD